MSYFLGYTLGLPSKAGKAASMGNVTHKAMELLAWQSYHRARGNAEFVEESFGPLRTESITPEWATVRSYEHYQVVDSHVRWTPSKDLPQLQEWTSKALAWSDGYFDPRNQDVIQPEQKFDLTIDKPWARYSYQTPQGLFEGNLSIKGTMDLVIRDRHAPDEIEVIDYKTGRRKDWGIEDEWESIKDWRKLMKDPQLLLYFYATRRLYPEAKHIHFTILFINPFQLRDGTVIPGGPFRMSFGDPEFAMAERMLEAKFSEIRASQTPLAKVGTPCYTFCSFGKNSRSDQDPSKTVCNYYRDQLRLKTADQIFYEIGNMDKVSAYGSGGGRQATV